MIPKFYVNYDLKNMAMEKSAYQDDPDDVSASDSDYSYPLSEPSKLNTSHLSNTNKVDSISTKSKKTVKGKTAKKTGPDKNVAEQYPKQTNITKEEKTHGPQSTTPTETKIKQDMNETMESLASIRLPQPNHRKRNTNTCKDERELNYERNGNRKQYSTERKGRYPKDTNSARTPSHGDTHMKRRNMNTQSQQKSPIKKRRKGHSDDVHMVETEDDSDDNPYAWTSDHEKIEVADFFRDASINPDSSDNEGIRCSKPAYEQEKSQESSENFDRKRQPKTKTSQHSRERSCGTRKTKKEVRDVYNKGYYTDNIMSDSLHQDSNDEINTDDIDSSSQRTVRKANLKNTKKPSKSSKGFHSHLSMSDSLHQDSDDEINTDDIDSSSQRTVRKAKLKKTKKPRKCSQGLNSQLSMSDSSHQDSDDEVNTDDIDSSSQRTVRKAKPKNTRKQNNPSKRSNSQNPDDWSDKAQDDFLETLREQPSKELSDTKNKWRLFCKRLQQKGTHKTPEQCKKQVIILDCFKL